MGGLQFIYDWAERIIILAVLLAAGNLLVPEGRVRGAVRLVAGLVMLLVMLEPVLLLLNGGLAELVTVVGDEAAWGGLAGALPVEADAEQVVRQGEAVWRAGWEPLLAAASARLDAQLAREIEDRFGEAAVVETDLAADGAVSGVKLTLPGPPVPGGADETGIRRWLSARLAVAESRVLVVRELSPQQKTAGGRETWPAGRAEPEMEGAGIE